jgi:hypothetical protein
MNIDMSPISLDPNDEFYSRVFEATLPPEIAYKYIPPESLQVTNQTKKGPGQRKLFEGWNNLTNLESSKL